MPCMIHVNRMPWLCTTRTTLLMCTRASDSHPIPCVFEKVGCVAATVCTGQVVPLSMPLVGGCSAWRRRAGAARTESSPLATTDATTPPRLQNEIQSSAVIYTLIVNV
eukprot:1389720-Pleurochrysis_carterae.AAC.1